MAKADLHAVPANSDSKPRPRAVTSSFRIPTYWFDKVQAEAQRLDISLSQVYLRALTEYFDTFDSESWSTVDDNDYYDPSRFYTHSEDRKGHSFHVRANIPKPLAGELSSLVQSGVVPAYRSIGDITRDAIYHRVKQVSQMVEGMELEQAVDMAMLLSEEMKLVDEAEHAEQLIDALRTNAQSMMTRDGNTTRLKRYLAQRRDIADSIPEPYRKDYLDAIVDYETRIAKTEKKTTRKATTRRRKT